MINTSTTILYQLDLLNEQNVAVNQKLSSGNAIDNGSDDSKLFANSLSFENEIKIYEGIENQLNTVTVYNDSSDSAIEEMKLMMDSVSTKVLSALNAGIDQSTKTSMSTIISDLKETLLNLVNEEVNGQYLFSGSDSTTEPFVMDSEGKVTYQSTNDYKTTLVSENLYKEQGVNGIDLIFSTVSEASQNESMTFSEDHLLIDSNNDEWSFADYDSDGVIDNDRIYKNGDITASYQDVTINDTTPQTYTFTNSEDTTIEAKENYFDVLDEIILALDLKDSDGNSINEEEASNILSNSLEKMERESDTINSAHSKLGGRNASFENYSVITSAKLTNYETFYQDTIGADLTKAAIDAQSLELTYSALYSSISKINSLSLVNYL